VILLRAISAQALRVFVIYGSQFPIASSRFGRDSIQYRVGKTHCQGHQDPSKRVPVFLGTPEAAIKMVPIGISRLRTVLLQRDRERKRGRERKREREKERKREREKERKREREKERESINRNCSRTVSCEEITICGVFPRVSVPMTCPYGHFVHSIAREHIL